MSRQRTSDKPNYKDWIREDRETYLAHVANLDAVYAVLRKKGITPTKAVELKQLTLEGLLRTMEPSRLALHGPPRTRRQQQADFARLGIPGEVYVTLQGWGAAPGALESVLRFLERVKFWRDARDGSINLGRRVHGRGRDPHNVESRPEEPGELLRLHMAVELLRFAIRTALVVHKGTCHAISDHRVAKAVPHMDAVLKELEKGYIAVDPTLPRRKRGQKPGLKFAFREGERPQSVRRKDLDRTLGKLLLPLHPHRSRPQANSLASKLLDPILQ